MELLRRRKRAKRIKRAAVLGCGPAGLFAAHALALEGWEFDIYSKPRQSHMYGAQYLHGPIPGLTHTDPVTVDYVLEGTVEGYRSKVYGTNYAGRVSVGELESKHQGWDIREAYNNAWSLYGDKVIPSHTSYNNLMMVDDEGRSSGLSIFELYPLVVSSVPVPVMCARPKAHQFHAQTIWAMGDAPDRGQILSHQIPEDTVICNGTREVGWYRLSNVFGHKTVEYPNRTKPPIPGISEVRKPIKHQCSCYDGVDNLLRVGRYGTWTKGVLSHQAFHAVREAL